MIIIGILVGLVPATILTVFFVWKMKKVYMRVFFAIGTYVAMLILSLSFFISFNAPSLIDKFLVEKIKVVNAEIEKVFGGKVEFNASEFEDASKIINGSIRLINEKRKENFIEKMVIDKFLSGVLRGAKVVGTGLDATLRSERNGKIKLTDLMNDTKDVLISKSKVVFKWGRVLLVVLFIIAIIFVIIASFSFSKKRLGQSIVFGSGVKQETK